MRSPSILVNGVRWLKAGYGRLFLAEAATKCPLCANATKVYDLLEKLRYCSVLGLLMRNARVSWGVSNCQLLLGIPITKLDSNGVVNPPLTACMDIDACVSNRRPAAAC
jgi:hypothetical protein